MFLHVGLYLSFTCPCSGSSADRMSSEMLIKEHLRDIMSTEDLDRLTCKMVRHICRYWLEWWGQVDENKRCKIMRGCMFVCMI